MSEPVLQVQEITKRFKENIILDNITFEIPDKAIFGIIGKSGCGKTTLLSILVGFLKPSKGQVVFRGKDITKVMRDVEMKFGFASQKTSFYNKLNALENLRYFGRLYGLKHQEIKDRSKELITMFGLDDAKERPGEKLSAGMQKRLDIACALINKPEVLILDEPTADLDPVLRREILDIVKKINTQGTTVIITSHILGEIDHLCTHVALLHEKRVIKIENPDKADNQKQTKVLQVETKSGDYRKLVRHLHAKKVLEKSEVNGTGLMIHTKNPEKALKLAGEYALQARDPLLSIALHRFSVSTIFESLVKEHKPDA